MMHQKKEQIKLKIYSLVGIISFSIPLSIYILWIYVFNLGATQQERVVIFNSYLPDFLTHRWDTTLLSIGFCVIALFFSVKSLNLDNWFWRTLNSIFLILSLLLLVLNLFSMM